MIISFLENQSFVTFMNTLFERFSFEIYSCNEYS